MELSFSIFVLLLCHAFATYDGEIDLMPLLINESASFTNETQKLVPPNSAAVNISRILTQHLVSNGTVNLRIQLALSSNTKTASSFRLNRIPTNGQCKSVFKVDVHSFRHRIHFSFCNNSSSREETFYYDLNPTDTSELSFVFAGDQLLFYVNCSKIYSRYIGNGSALHSYDNYETLFRAFFRSRGNGTTNLLAAYAFFGSGCVDTSLQCLKDLQQKQENYTDILANQVRQLNASLMEWGGCDCDRFCIRRKNKVVNGSRWKDKQKDCQCVNGDIVCNLGKTLSQDPKEGCPSCKKACFHSGHVLKHNDTFDDGHYECICLDGKMTCRTIKIVPANPKYQPTPAPTTPVPKTGCSICCDGSIQCLDNDGYCVCSCSGTACTKCSGNSAVHPMTGKCNNQTKDTFPYKLDYNYYIKLNGY